MPVRIFPKPIHKFNKQEDGFRLFKFYSPVSRSWATGYYDTNDSLFIRQTTGLQFHPTYYLPYHANNYVERLLYTPATPSIAGRFNAICSNPELEDYVE